MKWSFSRLNSFDICQYEWHEDYVEAKPRENSFHGAAGGFTHEVIEKYLNKELESWDLSPYFEEHFDDKVPYAAPYNKYKDLRQDWYDSVLDYFDNIDFPLDKYDVIGVEKMVEFNIDKYPFIGFIDLLLRDKSDGKLVLCDHKTSIIHKLKSGKISKADQQHFLEFRRQQYLYSKAVIEEFGDGSVKELWWDLVRQKDWIKIPFKQSEYQEAQDWALDTIHRIENETAWGLNPEFIKAKDEEKYPPFYCMNLCSQRSTCPHKNSYLDYLKSMRNLDEMDL